ncbi:hypothetical protein DMENIID0001_087000 [Sergentomyia squamirostris]
MRDDISESWRQIQALGEQQVGHIVNAVVGDATQTHPLCVPFSGLSGENGYHHYTQEHGVWATKMGLRPKLWDQVCFTVGALLEFSEECICVRIATQCGGREAQNSNTVRQRVVILGFYCYWQ